MLATTLPLGPVMEGQSCQTIPLHVFAVGQHPSVTAAAAAVTGNADGATTAVIAVEDEYINFVLWGKHCVKVLARAPERTTATASTVALSARRVSIGAECPRAILGTRDPTADGSHSAVSPVVAADTELANGETVQVLEVADASVHVETRGGGRGWLPRACLQ